MGILKNNRELDNTMNHTRLMVLFFPSETQLHSRVVLVARGFLLYTSKHVQNVPFNKGYVFYSLWSPMKGWQRDIDKCPFRDGEIGHQLWLHCNTE